MTDRIIFHIDVNSAYLSWTALEQLNAGSHTDLRLIPSIIGGDRAKRHGIVLAKSIPAKAYGITTGEPVVSALRKCPGLLIVPPDHGMYEKRSQELMAFLFNICPDIEQVSIDECYMDYTPIAGNYTSPLAAASIIKDSIRQAFGFTVNIGISNRKVLAKMASDFKKPDLVHTLYSWEIQNKIWPLPVSSLFLCGRSSVETLHKLGILTIGDLAESDPSILESHLKSHGAVLWQYANGIDDSTVVPQPTRLKGIGNSTTLSRDIIAREDACRTLLSLAESVGRRLRAEQEIAGQICTEIKYSTFRSVSHQTTLDHPTASTDILYKTACLLFDELWDGSPIRLLGLRTSKLMSEQEPEQLSLFDSADETSESEKQKKLYKALDSIRKKYGADAVTRGSLFPSDASPNRQAE